MNDPLSSQGLNSQRSVGSAIDLAWDEFEEAWTEGRQPRIEDFLSRVPEEERWEMLRALVKLEWALREKDGGQPIAESYRERFPEFDQQILREFGESTSEAPYGQQLGDYRLLERLGGGGMGDVYKAEHVRLSKTVALKVLASRALGDPHAIARFENEMRLIGRLEDHENLVRASDAREENGIHFLVMEYVDGVDLEQLVRRIGPLNFSVACELIRQAAVGLQHVHEHGLVHRDIKPSNLILNSSGRVKILDLGLARLQTSNPEATRLTRPGFALGTVDYMAPEQWDDSGTVDIRADIYSLGCTMYYLLAGSAPYSGPQLSSIKKKLMAHAAAPVPSIVQRRPECPEELDWTLQKLLAKEADERIDSPGEVAEAVRSFASSNSLKRMLNTESLARTSGQGGTDVVLKSALTDTEGKLAHKLAPTIGTATPASSWGNFSRRRFALVAAGALGLAAAALAFVASRDAAPHPLRADLGALPGVNGGWWFDEAPWYSPGIRNEMMKAVDQKEALIGDRSPLKVLEAARGADTTGLYADLRRMARPLVSRLPAGERHIAGHLIEIDPAKHDEADFRLQLRPIVDKLEKRDDLSATETHLYAVLQHKLGEADAEQIQETYRSALASYEESGQKELYALCAADLGRFCCDMKRYPDSFSWFDEGESRTRSPAWRVAVCCQKADAKRRCGYAYVDDALPFLNAAEAIEGLDKQHPLRAYIHERRAWAHLDKWQLNRAISEFNSAAALRKKQRGAQTRVHLFWIQQGIAMAHHYLGDQPQALAEYTALSNEIDSELKRQGSSIASDTLSVHLESEFKQRRPNIFERWADAHLFGAEPDYGQAVFYLTEAREKAQEEGFASDRRAPHLFAIEYKLLIVQLLAGRESAKDGRQTPEQRKQALNQVRGQFDRLLLEETKLSSKQRKVSEFARELARAVIALDVLDLGIEDEQVRNHGFDGLRTLLNGQNVIDGKVSRRDLDMLLLAIETLATSGHLTGGSLANVAQRLRQAAAKPYDSGEMDDYLLRYFVNVEDAVRQAVDKLPAGESLQASPESISLRNAHRRLLETRFLSARQP